jgi:hypothetical protein
MLGSEEYANDLGTPGSTSDPSILNFLPTDPDHNLAVSWHSYNFNTCSSLLERRVLRQPGLRGCQLPGRD